MQTGLALDGYNLEDELAKKLSAEIAKEIDFQVLRTLLYNDWYEIVLTPMGHEKSEAIDCWIKDECQGSCQHMGLVFLFEKQADAVMFALRFV